MDEYSKEEWFDVARIFNPELTWEQFGVDWDDFIKAKAEHEATQKLN